MKAKSSNKIFINSIKNLLANAAYKSKNKQIKHKAKAMLVKLIECEKLKEKDKTKTKKTKKSNFLEKSLNQKCK